MTAPTDRGTAATTSATARFEGHTPGPWRFDVSDMTIGPIADTSLAICTMDPLDPGQISSFYRHGPITHANAALIAAAPQLLAEAEDLRKQRDELLSALKLLTERIDYAAKLDRTQPDRSESATYLAESTDMSNVRSLIARVEAA